jgi:hypothetical protein
MLALANPMALIALAALAVPLVLHLIRRPVPSVRLGSLKFLTESQRRLRSVRWRDLLLLLLRCGVLAILALLLAGPRWVPRSDEPVRWVVLLPGGKLDPDGLRRVAELVAGGHDLHYLAPGFPREEPAPIDGALDAWSLMREGDFRLPAGSHWVVVGPAYADDFKGDRPVLRRLRVTWEATGAASQTASIHPAELPPAEPVRVAILAAADRQEEGRRVRAAMRALAVLGHPLVEVSENPDWIFQLGTVALPAAWRQRVQQGATLVTDAPQEVTLPDARTFEVLGQTHLLTRRADLTAQEAPEVVVIADSAGDPVAALSRIGRGWHWRFALRFHPASTSWVDESGFPAWWQDQMLANRRFAEVQSVIDPTQIEPRTEIGPSASPPLPRGEFTDLRFPFWLLALFLLGMERWLVRAGPRGFREGSA